MLFVVWTKDIIRPTQDLDMLGLGDSDFDALREASCDIMGTHVADDGRAESRRSMFDRLRDGGL